MNNYIEQAKSIINGRNDCPDHNMHIEECCGCFFYEMFGDKDETGKRLYSCANDEILLEKAKEYLNEIRTKKLERLI